MTTAGPIRNYSLKDMQALNERIYGSNNRLFFDPLRIVARIGRFGGRLHKAARCNDINAIAFHLVMTFSWSLALANKLGADIENELWKRYPGACSHCGFGPCMCKLTKEGRETVIPLKIVAECPRTLDEFQAMFGKIYPNNNALAESGHLIEELCEVLEAIDNLTGTSRQEFLADSVEELCDVLAHLFGVATCSKISLAEHMEKHFADGCCKCHLVPCQCMFPATTTVSPREKSG